MTKAIWAMAALAILAGCGDGDVYTLYRSSVVAGVERVHVATFDAKGRRDYNEGNCAIARDLFVAQPSVIVRYWCELGRYRG